MEKLRKTFEKNKRAQVNSTCSFAMATVFFFFLATVFSIYFYGQKMGKRKQVGVMGKGGGREYKHGHNKKEMNNNKNLK